MAERAPEKREVTGSTPVPATSALSTRSGTVVVEPSSDAIGFFDVVEEVPDLARQKHESLERLARDVLEDRVRFDDLAARSDPESRTRARPP